VSDDARPNAATPEERRALFRVVRGTPTDAELAALTVVLLATTAPATAAEGPASASSTWSDPATRLRRPLPVGPGAWRTAAWPR
jgi:hypothetical protein